MIGRVIGTEKRPNTAYTFYFWAEPQAPVGIGTLVHVESDLAVAGERVQVYGVVVEAHGFNDLESPLHEFLSVGGEPGVDPPTERPEMRVYEAAVLRRIPEEPIGAVPIGVVSLADQEAVQVALRTDSYAQEFGIAAGCYGDKSNPMPVHLHAEFLLGPEAGHLNMTGTSGLAAKTSFILFLLQSIFARPEVFERDAGSKGVAALLFNTKGGDLLYLDQPAHEPLSDLDMALYQAAGFEPGKFEKVEYFAPYTHDHQSLMTLRNNGILEAENPTKAITFGLAEVMDHLEVLLSRDDLDSKADSYLAYLKQMFVMKPGPLFRDRKARVGPAAEPHHAESLEELAEIIDKQLEIGRENGGDRIDGHHFYTIEKVKNRLTGVDTRFKGIISKTGKGEGPLDQPFRPGTIYVIDVSKMTSQEQDLVFSAVIRKLRDKMERQELGVKHLVVMVDELNKYAPSAGRDTAVVRALQDIAARGRYMGLTLFGAQQFRSRVDKEVVGNAATHVFGHIEAEELAQPGYSYFSAAVREKLGSMSPGEVLIKHPHFKQPIFVRFPRPGCMNGSAGMRRFIPEPERPLKEQIVQLAASKGLSVPEAKDLLANTTDDPQELQQALRALRKDQSPRAVLGRIPKLTQPAAAYIISDDPF
ncbi:MAG: hypothetical protein K1X67_22440 [Fimbriimonadaceae bacterium]|nr:hypothetical protein [Fimbriimonadaceae bacterium]